MLVPRLLLLALVLTTAACGGEPEVPASAADAPASAADAPAPEAARTPPPQTAEERQRLDALEEALATMEELVFTLEGIGDDPVAAWNRASDVAALMRTLEARRAEYAIGLSEEEAAERYPAQVRRLRQLTARLEAALGQINERPVVSQVLWEEVAKADRAAEQAEAQP